MGRDWPRMYAERKDEKGGQAARPCRDHDKLAVSKKAETHRCNYAVISLTIVLKHRSDHKRTALRKRTMHEAGSSTW